jgi:hypothetical protein
MNDLAASVNPTSEQNSSVPTTARHRSEYRNAARLVLRALANAALTEPQLRVALRILEWGILLGREHATFATHQDIADLDGKLRREQVTRALGQLRAPKTFNVITIDGSLYSFNPPSQWIVRPRAREGKQAKQRQLELEFEKVAVQQGLRLNELDYQIREDFLEDRRRDQCVPQTHSRPGSCVPQTLSGVSQTHSCVPQTPNGAPLKEELQGSKLKALRRNGAERDFMERVRSFLGHDAYENDGGKWRVRFRGKPTKCSRVIAAMEEDAESGKAIRCRPAHMEWTWNDFAD